MKDWEIIADNLSKAGWSWGCVSALDREGRTIWIADAHRDDGKRFVVRADESRWFVKVTIMLLSNNCNFRAILRNKSVSKFKPVAICLIWGCALTIPAHATTVSVTNTNDGGPGSLRQALAIANDGDTINATGISGTITLTSGQLLVDKSVTINGAGAA